MKFVPADRQSGHLQMLEIDRQLARDLDRVGVQRNARAGADFRQLGHGLEHARFVVGEHHAGEARPLVEQSRELIDRHDSFTGGGHTMDSPALPFELFDGAEHAGVFDRRDDGFRRCACGRCRRCACGRCQSACGRSQPENCQIVGLGPAAGEDQLVGPAAGQIGAQQAADFLAGVFQDLSSPAAGRVLAGRIGQAPPLAIDDGLEYLGQNGRGGVVVEIDVGHGGRPSGADPSREGKFDLSILIRVAPQRQRLRRPGRNAERAHRRRRRALIAGPQRLFLVCGRWIKLRTGAGGRIDGLSDKSARRPTLLVSHLV